MYRTIGALAVLMAGATAAHAGVVIQISNDSFGNSQDVLFGGSGLLNSGAVVQGRTSFSQEIVNFSDAGESMFGSGNDLEATDGGLRALRIGLAPKNSSYENLIFRLRTDVDGQVTITVSTLGGSPHVQTLSLTDGNTYRIFGTEGTRITSASFASTVDVERVDHIAIGTEAVPEPATMATIGIGIAGLIFRRRRAR